MQKKSLLSWFLSFLLILPFSSFYAQKKDEKISYTGIMLFMKDKDEILIVAPTLSEDLKEAGRISCERKRDFLEKYFQTKARIVEDRKMTEEDKFQNLIIIGKDNALLKEIWTKTPLRVTPDNFYFLGEEFSNPRDHAIFVQVSPFDETKLVLICTSIDPDLDKIRPIPMMGSDWVIMRDFSIIKQGRFYSGTSLPPDADPFASFDNRKNVEDYYGHLLHIESQFYVVFYPSDLPRKNEIKKGMKKRDAALSHLLKIHGIKPPEKKIRIYCYQDKEEKKEKSGVPDPIHFLDARKEIHMIEDMIFVDTYHEDAHVIAEFLLSDQAAIHLAEGFAIYCDGKWKGQDLDYLSGMLLRMDKVPSFADLLDEGHFSRLPSDLAFPLMGSITTFVIEKYGLNSFKKLLGHRHVNDEILKRTLGLDLERFRSKWEKDLRQRSAKYARRISFSMHQHAAKTLAEKNDFASSAKELIKALELIPDEPQTLYNLALNYMRLPKLEEAEKTLVKLLSLPLSKEESRFIVFAHYQLGRIYDAKGEREKAIEEYKKVLSFPDMYESHQLAREGLAQPATLEDLQQIF